jgi:TP901 family phage tail tape measure protein
MERSLRFDLMARDKTFGKVLDRAGRKGQWLNREFQRTLGGAGDQAGKQFGVRLHKRLGGGFSAAAGLARVGGAAIGAGLAAAGLVKFAKDSVSLAATFDKTMRQVAQVAKVPTKQIGQLRDTALDMGAKTSFSASQASEAMLALGKGGLSFAQMKAGGLQATLTLAAAGGLELGEAANVVIKSLGQFGLEADKAGDAAAALAGGANASTASVEDLGEALAQVGPGARNAGLSLQETVGVLAAFSDNGIRGSDAGTSLKTMLVNLVPATDKARNMMRKLGLDFVDAHGAILPITEIAQQLKDRLGKLSEAQRIAALQTIFGSDATRAATVLMQEGAAGLAKYIKATNDRGAAEKLAKENTKGAAGAFERLQGAIETVQIVIGDAFLPKLAELAEWAARKLPAALATLQERLRIIHDWWKDNADIIAVVGDALNTIFVPAAENAKTSTDDMRTSAQKLRDTLDGLLEFSLRMAQGFNFLAQIAGIVAMGFWDLVVAGGKVINVVDRLSGGTGHAADEMVNFARDMRDKTSKSLDKLAQDARDTQRAIDKMHGKNIPITASLKLNFSPSFSQKDWVAVRAQAGRMAAGGKIKEGTGPTADDVLALLSRGETVVPAADSARPEFKRWAARRGIPGFASGGPIGQIDSEARAVNKVQAGGTARRMDAGITKLLKLFGGNPAIQAFIRSTDALPYQWGAAGPGAYDCSGLVSAVLGKITGRGGGHGQRYFTTSSIRPGILGIKPGLGGVLQIGVTAGTGHMSGRYGGLGFEAESTRTGIKVGAAASRPESFARHFHLAKGGKVDPAMVARFAALAGADIGGDQGRLRVNGKVFDQGGFLPPGASVAVNRTGRPEPVGFPTAEEIADAIVRAWQRHPPVVAVRDLQTAFNGYAGRMGQPRPYR